MNRYIIIRDYKDEATPGTLIKSNGKKIICTLERPNLNNHRDDPKTKENESGCIPEGIYICKKYSSAKYPDTWEITCVKGRDKILIHCANYVNELLGCIAVCEQVIDMNPNNKDGIDSDKRWLASQSRTAFAKLKAELPKEFELEITSTKTLCSA